MGTQMIRNTVANGKLEEEGGKQKRENVPP
jgi:hypothetical protein